eukprot:COSAG04_NODE_2699_length_3714_cov_39.069499_2_plen_80_part_00
MPPQFFKKKAAGLTAMGAIEALVRFPLTRAFSPWRLRIGAGLGLTASCCFRPLPFSGSQVNPGVPCHASPPRCALASVI